jgi:L-ascorbate metabolism protein UlaG (beta-lactamase superfamily)
MKITKYIHSCLLIEKQDQGLLIDPGSFSFMEEIVAPETFTNVVGILITHAHKDHYDPDAIKKILINNPECRVYTNQELRNILVNFEVQSEILEEGSKTLGLFNVKAIPAKHDPLLVPVPQNTAFVIDDLLLCPGDSTDTVLLREKVRAIALPVAGPWIHVVRAGEFAFKYKLEHVIPVHDGHVKEFYSSGQYEMWQKVCAEKGAKFHNMLKVGDSVEIS